MKKTIKRLVACISVVMMVFALCTTAFADGGYYYGRMNSGFNCSQTFNKVRDRTVEDDNTTSTTGGYDSTSFTDYLSILKVGSITVSTMVLPSNGINKHTNDYTGTVRLRVENQATAPTYVRGRLFVYNGATYREITDPTHNWQ